MKEIVKYVTIDGVEFNDKNDAIRYESLIGQKLSSSDFQWMRTVSAKYYTYVPEGSIMPKTFKKGDVIHTIDYHYLIDPEGNDVDQNIIFVNKSIITNAYIVVSACKTPGDYICIKEGETNQENTCYVGSYVIFENYN